jgi:hypothetical protein
MDLREVEAEEEEEEETLRSPLSSARVVEEEEDALGATRGAAGGCMSPLVRCTGGVSAVSRATSIRAPSGASTPATSLKPSTPVLAARFFFFLKLMVRESTHATQCCCLQTRQIRATIDFGPYFVR